ncbi:MAG: DNA adenine methylase [Vulcanimicrobiota bacterium]
MQMPPNPLQNSKPRPFLKWAGGKTQILNEYEKFFPRQLKEGKIGQYFEPFIGGGAVFFYVATRFEIKKAYLSDINRELVLTYRVVQKDVNKLLEILEDLKEKHYSLDEDNRKAFYYKNREKYNEGSETVSFQKYNQAWIYRAALMIYLNKTCYNGLYRVNKKGKFNVPFGSYKQPSILDRDNLIQASELLQNCQINCCNYDKIINTVKPGSLVYFDPPYRPLNSTSRFTAYSQHAFNDEQQMKLASFFKELDRKSVFLMLSNSDPKNHDKKDEFFDKLYQGYHINRIPAKRMINSSPEKRGEINELLITNF